MAVQKALHIYLTGTGSSWHAQVTAAPLFSLGRQEVREVADKSLGSEEIT
jgi:fructoselysine-6-P-deglycase FrlB-like protein